MEEINFETLLGKNISEIQLLGYASNNMDDNIYLITEPRVKFLGRPIHKLMIGTREDKKIVYIHIIFSEQGNKNFYKIISDEYGENFDVMVLDQAITKETTSKEIADGFFTENLEHTSTILQKGTIHDKDLNHLLWSKEKFELMLFYNRFKNREEVHFIIK